MMGQDVDAAVAAAEKSAQKPADNADNKSTPERAPKTVDLKAGHDMWNHEEQEAVHDQDKKTECKKDQRGPEDQQNRANESVQYPEQKRGPDERCDCVVTNSVNDCGSNHYGNRRDTPANDEMAHDIQNVGAIRFLPNGAEKLLTSPCWRLNEMELSIREICVEKEQTQPGFGRDSGSRDRKPKAENCAPTGHRKEAGFPEKEGGGDAISYPPAQTSRIICSNGCRNPDAGLFHWRTPAPARASR